MRRTSCLTGIVFPALLAVLPGCEDDFVCDGTQLACGGVCVDVAISNQHCGACGQVCAAGSHCVANACAPDLICTAPEEPCGDACVDTTTSPAHCGSCTTACAPFADCLDRRCAAPLVVMQTSLMDRTVDRDLFVLQDLTFDLTKLDGATFATSRVIDHAVLPDGTVLLVAAETEGVFELFRASPRGGALTRLSGALVTGGDVQPGLVVSRDGRRVLYRADQDTDEVVDLYAVAITGTTAGAPVKLNGALVAGGAVSPVMALSADGRRAAYVADQDTLDLDEAYTVDLSATTPGAPVKLNPAIGSSIWDLAMSDDGARVVYRAEDQSVGRLQLSVVTVATPGVATPITYADGAEGHVEAYRLVPDGSAVVFTGSRNTFDESLWRAPLAPLAEATRLADGSLNQWVRADVTVSADGQRVYFRKVSGAFGFDRLFRVDVATPEVLTQLSPVGDTSADEVTDFVLAADGRSVVFRGGADGAEGGNPQPGTNGPIVDARNAPAIYHLDLTATTVPAPTLLSPAPDVTRDGIGGGYVVTADGARTIYRADHAQQGFSDAYLATVATAGTVRRVSPPLDQASDSTDVSLLTRF